MRFRRYRIRSLGCKRGARKQNSSNWFKMFGPPFLVGKLEPRTIPGFSLTHLSLWSSADIARLTWKPRHLVPKIVSYPQVAERRMRWRRNWFPRQPDEF